MGGLAENEWNAEEDESIFPSTDELSTENDSDDGYISTNVLEDIWDENQIHPEINARDDRLKMHDHIRKTKN